MFTGSRAFELSACTHPPSSARLVSNSICGVCVCMCLHDHSTWWNIIIYVVHPHPNSWFISLTFWERGVFPYRGVHTPSEIFAPAVDRFVFCLVCWGVPADYICAVSIRLRWIGFLCSSFVRFQSCSTNRVDVGWVFLRSTRQLNFGVASFHP